MLTILFGSSMESSNSFLGCGDMRENDHLCESIEVGDEWLYNCITVKDNWKYRDNYWHVWRPKRYWHVCGNMDLKRNPIIIHESFWWNLEDESGCDIIAFVENVLSSTTSIITFELCFPIFSHLSFWVDKQKLFTTASIMR